MTLVVEDGTGKVDAESYASIATVDTYSKKRGNLGGWCNDPAEVNLFLNTNPTDGDTITINGQTYRFKDTPAAIFDVQIGIDVAATTVSFIHAVNLTGVAGTDYYTGTTKHATCAASDGILIYALAEGVAANSYAVSASLTASSDGFEESTLLGGTAHVTRVDQEAALRRATEFLDSQYSHRWRGYKTDSLQALDWPRYSAEDDDDYLIDSELLPRQLVDATCLLAIAALSEDIQPDIAAASGELIRKKIKAGPVEKDVTYSGGTSTTKEYVKVDANIRELVHPPGRIRVV